MQFSRSRKKTTRSARQDICRRPLKRRRLSIDCLEDRQLLSAGSLATPGTGFQVNTYTAGTETTNGANGFNIVSTVSPRAVAMDSNGDAAVVWLSPDANGDGNWTLMVQLYTATSPGTANATLTPQGGNTVVTSDILSMQNRQGVGVSPAFHVARAAGGDFVLLWDKATLISGSSNNYSYSTYAQVYGASGTALTGTILVASGSNVAKSVAMNDNGFDVLYGAIGKARQSSSGYTLTMQRYTDAGSTVGKPISVVTPALQNDEASISMDSTGNSVVVWDDINSSGQYLIRAQRYNRSGQAQGGVIQVNPTATANIQDDSNVAMDPATGDFVVAWQEWMTDPSGHIVGLCNVYARQFSANGTPVPTETNSAITVATATFASFTGTDGKTYYFGTGGMPANDSIGVAALPAGNGAFDVSWTNVYDTLQPSSSTSGYTTIAHDDIYAATYAADSSGTALQSIQVTTNGNGNQFSSAAIDAGNDLLVVFSGPPPVTGTSDTGDVFGQFYADPPAPQSGSSTGSSSGSAFSPRGPSTPDPWQTADSVPPVAFENSFVDEDVLNALVRGHTARRWR